MRRKTKNIKKGKNPKWWIITILAPIVVGLVLAIINLIIPKLFEYKFGNLQITCNSDSARIYLNNKLKGLTLIDSLITIESLKSGTYILSVEKDGYEDNIYDDIKIIAGNTTSQYVELIPIVPPVKRFRILNFFDKGLNNLIENETGYFHDDNSNYIDFLISFMLTREIERVGSSNLFRIRRSNLAIYVNGQLRKEASEFKFPAFWARARPKQALEDTLRTMMHNQIVNKKSLIAKYIIDCIK